MPETSRAAPSVLEASPLRRRLCRVKFRSSHSSEVRVRQSSDPLFVILAPLSRRVRRLVRQARCFRPPSPTVEADRLRSSEVLQSLRCSNPVVSNAGVPLQHKRLKSRQPGQVNQSKIRELVATFAVKLKSPQFRQSSRLAIPASVISGPRSVSDWRSESSPTLANSRSVARRW